MIKYLWNGIMLAPVSGRLPREEEIRSAPDPSRGSISHSAELC